MQVATIEALIDNWSSLGDFANAAGVTYGAAKQMRRRGSIAVVYWQALIDSSVGQQIGLTADTLVRLHSAETVGAIPRQGDAEVAA